MQIHSQFFSEKGLMPTGKGTPHTPNLQGEIILMFNSFHNNRRDQCHVFYKEIEDIYF